MNKFLKYSLIFLVALSFASCQKLVEGLEEDPNNPSDAPVSTMYDGMEIANLFVHEGELARLAGMWMGYYTGSDRQYISYQNYNVTAGDFDNAWGNLYWGVVAQSRIIQDKATLANNPKLRGIAKIMEAHAIGTATSLWGDVPSLEVNDFDQFPEPKFDDQVALYASLQTLLSTAVEDLNDPLTAGETFGSSTVLGSWEEVAQTLKARYYIHVGNYTSALEAAQGVSNPNNVGGVSSTASNWTGLHNGALDGLNVYYRFMDYDRGGYMTADGAYLDNILSDSIGGVDNTAYRGNAKTDESVRRGFYYFDGGYGAVDPNWDTGMFAFDASFPLITYVENQLIMAECQWRASDYAAAVLNLNNVRADHAATYGVMYDAYIFPDDFDEALMGIASIAGSTPEAALLMEIAEEKYVSMYGQIEAFNDFRRWDNILNVPLNTGSQTPERFIYPQSEIGSNSNVPSPLPGIFDATDVH